MSIVVNALLTAALVEIRSARGGDVINPDDMDLALLIFNEYLDALNIDGRALYTTAFPSFTLTPNLQPHTIGIAANAPTFVVPIARPTMILGANLIISPSIRVPLTLRDGDWWMNVRARSVTSATPTDLNYSPDWPNGALNLLPIPNAANGLELQTRTLLAQVALTDTLDLPPGYQQLLRLTTAELLAAAFGQTVSASTAKAALEARARVWGANDVIPNLRTRDAGVPGGQSGGGFNYRTG